jgi:putative sterol carrier protein
MGVRENADIVLSAPYSILHQILLGKLNAVKAILTRKAKIKGPMAKVLKYNSATNHFVKVLQSIPVEFDGDFEPLVVE